jgi:hypothetical protein
MSVPTNETPCIVAFHFSRPYARSQVRRLTDTLTQNCASYGSMKLWILFEMDCTYGNQTTIYCWHETSFEVNWFVQRLNMRSDLRVWNGPLREWTKYQWSRLVSRYLKSVHVYFIVLVSAEALPLSFNILW